MARKVYTTEAKLRGSISIDGVVFDEGKVLSRAYRTSGPEGQTWVKHKLVLPGKTHVFRIVIDEKAEELLSEIMVDVIERAMLNGRRKRVVK
ncbi:MAG TPA: hypothetical protein VGG32_06975 [Thermoplasmata archaeon]|jgi:hypothetical protein